MSELNAVIEPPASCLRFSSCHLSHHSFLKHHPSRLSTWTKYLLGHSLCPFTTQYGVRARLTIGPCGRVVATGSVFHLVTVGFSDSKPSLELIPSVQDNLASSIICLRTCIAFAQARMQYALLAPFVPHFVTRYDAAHLDLRFIIHYYK